MFFKKTAAFLAALLLCLSVTLCGCTEGGTTATGTFPGIGTSGTTPGATDTATPATLPITTPAPVEPAEVDWQMTEENGILTVTQTAEGENATATFALPAGATYTLAEDTGTLAFVYAGQSGEEVTFILSGTLLGALTFDVGEADLVVELSGFTLTSSAACPLQVLAAASADLSAKKETENAIYDTRETAEDPTAALYAVCDLKLKGTGSLTVTSENGNGIHSKDNLTVQKLTLTVQCLDNALKGNDQVKITSGQLLLIATEGDGIKTSNTTLSAKGNQKGCVLVEDGTLEIYAACDGIDAAADVTVSGGMLTIRTDKYSPYSQALSGTAASGITDSTGTTATFGLGAPGGGPGGFQPGGGPGGGQGGPGGGFPGGGGAPGGQDGNQDKSDTSTKGIKAGSSVTVTGGTLDIASYDDAIHANGGETLESGTVTEGNVTITGGTLTLCTGDDGIHADGKATVSDGIVTVTASYEGIEGSVVEIAGGTVSVTSTDDGLNGTGTSGTSIVISGGTLYVFAGGDGVDSNSTDSYGGILFSGGRSVIFSTGQADSAIDTERGYRYTGGLVVAVGLAGGMSQESTMCANFSSVGCSGTLRLQAGTVLSVSGVATVQAPAAMNALVVVLGSTSATISTVSSAEGADGNGVCWLQ